MTLNSRLDLIRQSAMVSMSKYIFAAYDLL